MDWAAWLESACKLTGTTRSVVLQVHRSLRFDNPVCVVLRGLLGERLRSLRCLTGAPSCDGCSEWTSCDYAKLFAPPSEQRTENDRGTPALPFWLRGLPASNELSSGATYEVCLSCVGLSPIEATYLEVSLRDALERLGRREEGILRPIKLSPTKTTNWTISLPAEPAPKRLRLFSRTPFLLRGDWDEAQQECPEAPWFAVLVRAGVRRVNALLRASGFETAALERPSLTSLRVLDGGTQEWHGERFSHRQKHRYPTDGIEVDALLTGKSMAEVLPLLRLLESVSVGKATSMGFGHLQLDVL